MRINCYRIKIFKCFFELLVDNRLVTLPFKPSTRESHGIPGTDTRNKCQTQIQRSKEEEEMVVNRDKEQIVERVLVPLFPREDGRYLVILKDYF